MDSAELISLNVGGTVFTTTVGTLTKDPDSMLAAMFCSANLPPAKKGPFISYTYAHKIHPLPLSYPVFGKETHVASPTITSVNVISYVSGPEGFQRVLLS